MVQTRKVGFGALIQSDDMPTDISNIMAPGRLIGMDFSATAVDQLNVSPGSCLLPDGVIILEDNNRTIQISNTAFAADYTVVYKLQSTNVIGGSSADLLLMTGISKQSNFTDATVLGWIQYPGGSVALDPSFFLQPNPIRINPPPGILHTQYLPPFVEALRPPTELKGGPTVKTIRLSNMNLTQAVTTSFGGIPARVLGATVLTDTLGIPANPLSNDTFSVNKTFVVTGNISNGASTITGLSDTSQITVGQVVSNNNNGIPAGTTVISAPSGGSVTISAMATSTVTASPITFGDSLFTLSTATNSIVAGSPKPLPRVTGLPTNKFVIGPTDTLTAAVQTTVIPPSGIPTGEFDIALEMPASSGNWQESMVTLGSETALRFFNTSPLTLTYDFRLPFIITGEGQPHKLVTRLNVDFNCIVTFELVVGGTVLTLSPVSGTVANTGGLITREFQIPTLAGVTWTSGTTAYIDVSINAQAGGSAAFSYIGLTLENTPYLLFI